MMLLRRRLGLDQSEFAKLLGYARPYVNRVENGHYPISDEIDARLIEIERTKETSLKGIPLVAEDSAPYGSSPKPAGLLGKNIKRDIDEHMRLLLIAAGSNIVRQAWVLEQLRNHVSVPARWHVNMTEIEADLDELGRQAEVNIKALKNPQSQGGAAAAQAS